MDPATKDNYIIYVYVLAPLTAVVAVGVISYITIQSRRLRKEMLESGQLIGVVPAVISINSIQSNFLRHEDVRSPDGLPPPPPYNMSAPPPPPYSK